MVKQLREPTALPEVLSSISRNHMIAYNHLHSYGVLRYIIQINKSFLKTQS